MPNDKIKYLLTDLFFYLEFDRLKADESIYSATNHCYIQFHIGTIYLRDKIDLFN